MQLLPAIGIAVIVFISTNVDDLLLLAYFFSNPKLHARQIVLGQFLAIGLLTTASLICGLASVFLPAHDLAYLGVLPLALGLWQLYRLRQPTRNMAKDPVNSRRRDVFFVTAVTLAHGADNLAVYIPLFATSSGTARGATVGVFAVMTVVWCYVSYSLVRHPIAAGVLRRLGPWSAPFVLIGLGIWILLGTMY